MLKDSSRVMQGRVPGRASAVDLARYDGTVELNAAADSWDLGQGSEMRLIGADGTGPYGNGGERW